MLNANLYYALIYPAAECFDRVMMMMIPWGMGWCNRFFSFVRHERVLRGPSYYEFNYVCARLRFFFL